jgi:hypothetical protein
MPCSSSCTLKPSPELSHTRGLIEVSTGIMAKQGVRTEIIRAVDHDIATGVWPDMTEHGGAAVPPAGQYSRSVDTQNTRIRALAMPLAESQRSRPDKAVLCAVACRFVGGVV